MNNQSAVSAIEIRDVVKSYRDVAALKSVSLSIPQGSFFALLGPNGAGKSTLISIIAGLVKADAGHVNILGHDVVSDYADARRLIGLVPQELIDEPFLRFKIYYVFKQVILDLVKSNGHGLMSYCIT